MTTPTFHEGQEVEVFEDVLIVHGPATCRCWRKAKIVGQTMGPFAPEPGYIVQFPGGSRGVFDAEHIRAAKPSHDLAFDRWDQRITE